MDGVTDDPQGRRREQVRKAQKTHRARKAVYVKSLETEVEDLRKQNAVHVNVIQQLQALLGANGIQIPSHLAHPRNSGPLGAVSVTADKRSQQQVVARLPSADFISDTYDSKASQVRDQSQLASSDASHSSSPPRTITNRRLAAHEQGLDSTQVAINFVLALEQPCLHHHKIPSPELLVAGGIGTGHQAMLSSPIVARSPAYSLNPLKLGFNSGSQWAVPTAELEALLQSSHKLPLSTEVTPIQIWQLLKNNPMFNYLTFDRLEVFRETLLPMIKCYGFGAVIDQPFLEEALEHLFSFL